MINFHAKPRFNEECFSPFCKSEIRILLRIQLIPHASDVNVGFTIPVGFNFDQLSNSCREGKVHILDCGHMTQLFSIHQNFKLWDPVFRPVMLCENILCNTIHITFSIIKCYNMRISPTFADRVGPIATLVGVIDCFRFEPAVEFTIFFIVAPVLIPTSNLSIWTVTSCLHSWAQVGVANSNFLVGPFTAGIWQQGVIVEAFVSSTLYT